MLNVSIKEESLEDAGFFRRMCKNTMLHETCEVSRSSMKLLWSLSSAVEGPQDALNAFHNERLSCSHNTMDQQNQKFKWFGQRQKNMYFQFSAKFNLQTSKWQHSLTNCHVRADEGSSGEFASTSTSERIATLRTPRPQSTRQRLNTVDFDSTRWQLGDVRSMTCATPCFRTRCVCQSQRRSTVQQARRCALRAVPRCRSRSPPATTPPHQQLAF